MPRLRRPLPHRLLAAVPLFAACAFAGALQAQHVHGAAAPRDFARSVPLASAEYQGFLAGLDSMWIAFDRGSDTLSSLDRLVLDDLAEILAVNHGLELRLWASAPDAVDPRGSGARRTGSATPLARRRREAVRAYLSGRGVDAHQLRLQAADPPRFPSGFKWNETGGAFVFVARRANVLNAPPRFARVRVRAHPEAEVYFIPRAIADRDSTRVLCAPPQVALQDRVGLDSIIERPYPARPIVGVSRDRAGVVRTRRHEVDPRKSPDVLDLTTAAPEPRCRP